MEKRPKRRKFKDNPYTLNYDEENNINIISFKDVKGNYNVVTVDKVIYDEFNKFELEDLSMMNEYDNHIEHTKLYESVFFRRIINFEKTIDKIVEEKILFENINKEIKQLPEIQQRRLKKYFYENKNYREIAEEEHCTKRAVKFSIDIAIEKIRKNFNI